MTSQELWAKLRSLGARGLKGRHAYAVTVPPEAAMIPASVHVRRLDGRVLLLGRKWPPGEYERRRAVGRAFAAELAALSDAPEPLLLLIDEADPLIGEIDSLAPLSDHFLGDDRMALFCCVRRPAPQALADAPPQLLYQPGAGLRRLSEDFNLEIVETE